MAEDEEFKLFVNMLDVLYVKTETVRFERMRQRAGMLCHNIGLQCSSVNAHFYRGLPQFMIRE